MTLFIENNAIIRVRYAETDMMGVVYNGNYLSYFEVGRTELMRANGLPYTEFEKAGYFLPLVESYVKYKTSAYYDNLLNIHAKTDLKSISSTIRFEYIITCNENIIAEGFTKHSFMKKETMRPVRPPALFVDLINDIENKLNIKST